MKSNRLELVYFVILIILNAILAFEDDPEYNTKTGDKRSEVEVRTVFINCNSEELSDTPDSETTRFERAELFKHSVLKDCYKKLALTVKIISESDSSGDEYLPIEHVFEGSNNKQIRLLNPYILRLRRDSPLQAYKLRRLETVRGVLLKNAVNKASNVKHHEDARIRVQRDIDSAANGNATNLQSDPEALHDLQTVASITTDVELHELSKCEENNVCSDLSNTNKRCKRNEHNIVVEAATDEDSKWLSKDYFHKVFDREKRRRSGDFEDGLHDSNHKNVKRKKETPKKMDIQYPKSILRKNYRPYLKTRSTVSDGISNNELHEMSLTTLNKNTKSKTKKSDYDGLVYSDEKDYAIYEVGSPELWYTVHVQLFEKLSTPEGKTVWNDLTKGDIASVSSLSPEWIGQDLNVRYRSTRWIPREEFTLPTKRLCLLVPINVEHGYVDSFAENFTAPDNFEEAEYIVVPEEDIVGLRDSDANLTKRNEDSETESPINSSESIEQKHRKVVVRVAKALLGRNNEKFNVVTRGTDRYLTLPHRRQQRAQLDVEARADNNELVRVGSSGRISIAVADSTRRARTVLNLQVGNTGLAAARFRVSARDFDPLLSDLSKEATISGPILIPPRHTRSLRLELPVEVPVDLAHCTVSLINDEDQSVAIRDVAIKKGDRCFCVWHCACVCLSDDPNLLCRDMDEARQKAAGLSTRDRTRHTRSVCYDDNGSLNYITIFFGVLLFAFLCGLIKAMLGLACVSIATCGMERLLQMPRKLDHYYEDKLRGQRVVYDKEGWPIHPQTKTRTVRLLSTPVQFMLNAFFFLIWPCRIVYDGILKIKEKVGRAVSKKPPTSTILKNDPKKCYSSQDMQMEPLMREKRPETEHVTSNATLSYVDSEQDDTEYVLTQMQKSRESLARSQKKQNEFESTAGASITKETIK
ncbi:uncharacterized protein LOC142978269 isoform X2 [Anticarsia gemmatalis]|uniref:uncharacterized protein LOC142978269 isoform X2 n=1 Tax=Anticarsia gemmatalis TaxID=129554 RepID=UPI003F768BF3